VSGISAEALGAHRSATGSGMGPTVAAPGAISVNAGALAYGISITNGLAGLTTPTGYTNIATMSDLFMKTDGEYDAQYTVSPTGGTTNPEWTWHYTLPSSWLATVLALNPTSTTPEPPPPLPPPPPPPPSSESASDFMTGGGKLSEGREFASFGLAARASGGEFQWVQHCPNGTGSSAACAAGKFSFHGDVTAGSYATSGTSTGCRSWSGVGSSKEKGAQSFSVSVGCDNGKGGRGVDYIEVQIGDYQNAGYLSGGNIQLHKDKSEGA